MASRFFATENRSFAAAYQSKDLSVISGAISFFIFGAAASFRAAGALATGFDLGAATIFATDFETAALVSACGAAFVLATTFSVVGFLAAVAVCDFEADFGVILVAGLAEALGAATLDDFTDAETVLDLRDFA